MGWQDNLQTDARHIVALSGGKDSSALAVYLRDKIPSLEYVFCDTGEELPETYDYLFKLENYLGKKIQWLKSEKDFKYYLDLFNGVLPDSQARWCTRVLKLLPYNDYIGNDTVFSYVGIRADEPTRKGFIPTKGNIQTVLPFFEDNIVRADVFNMLEDAGLGVPDYYKWRSRSGCFFCFYQQKREWVGLLENHPDLFWKARAYEKENFTWIEGESLLELSQPERVAQIKKNYQKRLESEKCKFIPNQRLCDIFNI